MIAGGVGLGTVRTVGEKPQSPQGDLRGELAVEDTALDDYGRVARASPTAAILAGVPGAVLSRTKPLAGLDSWR